MSEASLERGSCVRYGEVEGDENAPLKIYQEFPLEDLKVCHEADFVGGRVLFDLIVGSWTMLHLADPLGTLVQLYSMLAPAGILLVNFCYAHIGDGEKERLKDLVRMLPAYEIWLGHDETICLR